MTKDKKEGEHAPEGDDTDEIMQDMRDDGIEVDEKEEEEKDSREGPVRGSPGCS